MLFKKTCVSSWEQVHNFFILTLKIVTMVAVAIIELAPCPDVCSSTPGIQELMKIVPVNSSDDLVKTALSTLDGVTDPG